MPDDYHHPGQHVRRSILPDGMSVTAAAKQLGVGRPALSNFLNGKASLSTDMALRLEKAFGASSKDLWARQAAYDQYLASSREPEIAVRAYAPPVLSITALQIEAWSERLETRAELAVFLRKLVASTAIGLTKLDFPAYENSQRPGWDGRVVADSATPWIPLGTSGWEFGVSPDIEDKADHDYRARTSDVDADLRTETTFVFVTPRNWKAKEAWVVSKRKQDEWKDVKAYDASDLEQWLEGSIPTQAWLSEQLPLGSSDIESLDACWQIWAGVTDPQLSKDLFRSTAESNGKKLAKWLAEPAGRPFTVVADSSEEALAALVCAFDTAPLSATRASDRATVVRSAAALSKIARAASSAILIVASSEAELASAGIHRKQHTIVVTRRNALQSEPDVTVDLVDDATFHEVLRRMGVDTSRITQLRHESGLSQTVLRRRLATLPAIQSPPWGVQQEIARRLIPLVLVGSWNTSLEADKSILSEIAAASYDEIERTVAQLGNIDQSPVWSIGDLRGVVSKTDAFYAIRHLITSADLQHFFRVARVVLSEADPALELPEDKRWASALYGKSRKHSGPLREGLCETLVLLAVHGDNLFRTRLGFNVVVEVNQLIHDLLTPFDPTTWLSQQHDLPRYAEAAPDVFLDLLEEELRLENPKVYALMTPADSTLFSSPGRTGLLWALENLAWNPRRLFRVVSLLAKLASLGVKDNWLNSPENSLAAIFRSWMPQTGASIDQRLAALDRLISQSPDVGWRICIQQFDPSSTVGEYSSRPRWRSDASGAGDGVSGDEVYRMARHAFELAVAWHSHTDRTLGDLVERIRGVPQDQDKVWMAVTAWAATEPDESQKAALRERIRRSAMTVRSRRGGGDTQVSPLARAAYEALIPGDVVLRHEWLFARQWVEESANELADDDLDFRKREERIAKLRTHALLEIWKATGFGGVARLCVLSEAPRVIGWHLAASVLDDNEIERFVADVLSLEISARTKLRECLAGLFLNLDPKVRRPILTGSRRKSVLKTRFPATLRLDLLLCAPFEPDTWEIVDKLPKRLRQAYWKDVAPSPLFGDAVDPNYVVDELLQADRPRAAFNAVHMVLSRVSSERLIRVLAEVGAQHSEPTGQYQLSAHDISNAFEDLSQRAEVATETLAQLELLYIEALDRTRHGIKNLERQLAASPDFFAQALVFAFKRAGSGEDPAELQPVDSQAAAKVASLLLSRARLLPGTNEQGEVDIRALRDWLIRARSLANLNGREAIGDEMIGQLLGRSPDGADGMWPSEPLREVLEDLGTPKIASGMITGRHNGRGAAWVGEGGGQERALAAGYRESAADFSSQYPFTARMLESMAAMYERQAEWLDTDAISSRRLSH